MSTEDDKTPRRDRPRSHWGDEEPVAAEFRRRDAARSSPYGVPVLAEPYRSGAVGLPPDSEMTAPSERILADPIASELWSHIEHAARRAVARDRALADQLAGIHQQAIATPDNVRELVARLDDIDSDRRGARKLAWSALSAAIGALVAVGIWLYARGEYEGAAEIRLEHVERSMEKAIDQQREDLRDVREALGRRSLLTPHERAAAPVAPTFTASKGTEP